MENESYEEYKARRSKVNKYTKRRLKGFLFWDSSKRGTYKKEYIDKLAKEISDES